MPARLMAFLDRLGDVLAERGDAVALLGLGSVGLDLHRLDRSILGLSPGAGPLPDFAAHLSDRNL